MNTQANPSRITFAVDPVERATEPLATGKPQESVRGLIGTPVEACSDYTADCVREVGFHPLLTAADLAFNQHRPLVLSPDMIWVTIVQGAARHVINHAERLRPLFVGHEGKLKIEVGMPGLHPGSPENAWDQMIQAFSTGVREHLGATYDRLVGDFSTTGPVERLACEVALLDMSQPYFLYRACGICGIPEITLEGTVADWRRLRAQVDHLAPYDLDWWLPSVRAICDQFARAAAGDVDLPHWQNIYKQKRAYGGGIVNGWLVKLIPYLKSYHDRFTLRNPLLDDPDATPGTSQLPSGVSQVPFRMRWEGRSEDAAMELLGGPVGVTQDPTTLALRPLLGWAVRPLAGREGVLARLEDHAPRPPLDAPEFGVQMRRIEVENYGVQAPDDFVQFYQKCNGVDLTNQDGAATYRFRQLEEIEVLVHPEPRPMPDADASGREVRAWRDEARRCRVVALVCDLPDGSMVGLDLRTREAKAKDFADAVRLSKETDRKVIKVGPDRAMGPAACPVIASSFDDLLQRVLDGEALTPLA